MNQTAKNAKVAKKKHRSFCLAWRTWRPWRFNLLGALKVPISAGDIRSVIQLEIHGRDQPASWKVYDPKRVRDDMWLQIGTLDAAHKTNHAES